MWFWGFRGKTDAGEYACQNTPVRVAGISDAVDICAAFESLVRQASGEYFVFSADDYSVKRVELP